MCSNDRVSVSARIYYLYMRRGKNREGITSGLTSVFNDVTLFYAYSGSKKIGGDR